MLKIPKINYYYAVLGAVFIYLIFPHRFACIYRDYLEKYEIYDNLVQKTTKNVSISNKGLGVKCEYQELLEENLFLYKKPYIEEVINTNSIRLGGEYMPEDCAASFSTAIIIPYRQRENQLSQFLIYMHNFLRRQQIHYRIFIIEQNDPKPFNRAKLFNIGAVYAMKLDFPCLILQDVDLMPLRLGNIYSCSKRPRHMSSALDKFRFNLPYYGLFGGAVAIESDTFIHVNGMSNMFQGWGGEDDDFYGRLVNKNYKICRFDPAFSQYTMLKHAAETPSSDRITFLKNGPLRYNTDGLNSLVYKEVDYKLHNLFTHILVET